ncbi:response regulator transcription factor [Ahrensia kielensis]|uniref:Response regulator transcription factor n=1 Tax=Ahrensia kielensis TaxID=76980 RepID=A0ABU9T8R3_9HYPH
MIVIVDSRELVRDGFKAMFLRLGYPATTTCDSSMEDFLEAISDADLKHVQAFLIGDCRDHAATVSEIRARTKAPLIAVLDQSSLTDILFHFENGADDVIKKPVHVTEILARAAAIRRRSVAEAPKQELGRLRIFNDGRDPEIDGVSFPLPRRERRILEYLASIGDRRASRTQIYNSVYGVLEQDVDECVVESHISKLRKKLRAALGEEVIDSKRFLGYRLMKPADLKQPERSIQKKATSIAHVSLAQDLAAKVS